MSGAPVKRQSYIAPDGLTEPLKTRCDVCLAEWPGGIDWTHVCAEVVASAPAKAVDSRLAWSLDALELLGFVALMTGRRVTHGDSARAAVLVERARELGLTQEEDPRGGKA